jgi:hypothetical protein
MDRFFDLYSAHNGKSKSFPLDCAGNYTTDVVDNKSKTATIIKLDQLFFLIQKLEGVDF